MNHPIFLSFDNTNFQLLQYYNLDIPYDNDTDCINLLLTSNKELIGYCIVDKKNNKKYTLHHLYINDQYRNMGYGRMLLDETVIIYNNYCINLFVDKNNIIAISLYKKFGFKEIHRLSGFIEMQRN